MPSVWWNRDEFDGQYPWADGGEEWSEPWGGSELQWQTALEPRLRAFLPTGHLLEIAPGFGRWTRFLLTACREYVGVDLSQRCVAACQARFADDRHAHFRTTDGRTLPGVPDGWVDFAFSFDSLVHVESDVLASYVGELARTLAPDGVAFLHHSNLGAYRELARLAPTMNRLAAAVPALRGAMTRTELAWWDHARARSVTAQGLRSLAAGVGLSCPTQELISWGGHRLIDAISILTRPGSRWDQDTTVVVNRNFTAAARSTRVAALAYGRFSAPET